MSSTWATSVAQTETCTDIQVRKQMLEQERWERTDVTPPAGFCNVTTFKVHTIFICSFRSMFDWMSISNTLRYQCNTRLSWTSCWATMSSDPCQFVNAKFYSQREWALRKALCLQGCNRLKVARTLGLSVFKAFPKRSTQHASFEVMITRTPGQFYLQWFLWFLQTCIMYIYIH